jgi:hypothetical protein
MNQPPKIIIIIINTVVNWMSLPLSKLICREIKRFLEHLFVFHFIKLIIKSHESLLQQLDKVKDGVRGVARIHQNFMGFNQIRLPSSWWTSKPIHQIFKLWQSAKTKRRQTLFDHKIINLNGHKYPKSYIQFLYDWWKSDWLCISINNA